MKKILKNSLLLLVLLLICYSCTTITLTSSINNGDLVFVTAKDSGLSGAINSVTQKSEVAKYDHVGIIKKDGNQFLVYHAAPKGGSQKEQLKDFLKTQKAGNQRVILYRLKPQLHHAIPDALLEAEKLLGKPYNFSYILDDESLYCSDFIERIFRKYNVFALEPMTFIDPSTGKTHEFWRKFYDEKKIKVPEGELGCNPNGLAHSSNIYRLKEL